MEQIAEYTHGGDFDAWLDEADKLDRADRISNALSEADLLRLIPFSDKNPTIGQIQEMRTKIIREMKKQSLPWIQNIIQIRGGYIFGSGMYFVGADEELQKIRRNPKNKDFLTYEWLEKYNQELLCSGNVFVIRNKRDNHYFMLDINEITDIVVDPNDKSYITHIVRQETHYNGRTASQYAITRQGLENVYSRKSVKDLGVRVNDNYEFYHFSTVRNANEPLSTPILMNTLFYLNIASRYLSDLSRYKHSQMLLSAKIRTGRNESSKKAKTLIASADQAGGFANLTGSDMDITNLAANGLNITNAGSIEFLAAAAAAATIPVNALSESMLGASGTESGLRTLDTPTQNYYKSQRRILKENIEELLGGNATVKFIPISEAEKEAEVKQVFIAMQEGILSRKDYRNFIDRYYEQDFAGALPKFKDTYKGQAMRYQFELNDEFGTYDEPTETNPDDPTNEGGENDERDKDAGQNGKGKRTPQSEVKNNLLFSTIIDEKVNHD
jgi:hypothetical protein